MAITVPLRHELKFYINPVEYQVLSRQLDRVLERDPNGDENNEYHIRSLYFDTIYNDALLDKLDGVKTVTSIASASTIFRTNSFAWSVKPRSVP